ncbi:MAG: hypothetical protein LC748_07385 [Thermomicrobia bacterium]|nr:hypothetical protein [Thermomicrobia bacterium]
MAMPKEMTHLEGLLREHGARWEGTDAHGPRRFDRVTFNDMPLVLTTCWVGMVAAAAATEAMIAHYAPRAILNYGCTGAHRDDLMLGDVVIGTACVAYDHGRLLPGGAFEHTPKRLRADDETKLAAFPTSTALLAVAESIAGLGQWRAEPWPEATWLAGQPHRAPRVWFGPVASADRLHLTTARGILNGVNVGNAGRIFTVMMRTGVAEHGRRRSRRRFDARVALDGQYGSVRSEHGNRFDLPCDAPPGWRI